MSIQCKLLLRSDSLLRRRGQRGSSSVGVVAWFLKRPDSLAVYKELCRTHQIEA